MRNRSAGVAACLTVLATSPCPAQAWTVASDLMPVLEAAVYPLTLAEDVMVLLALGLVSGRDGKVACRRGVPAFLAGLLVACGLLVATAVPAVLWLLALVLALWLGLIVAADLELPSWLVAVFAALAGFSVGLDVVPVARTSVAELIAIIAGAAVLSAALWLAVAVVVAKGRRVWQRIAARIAGSWIAAIAALLIALYVRT